MTAQRFVCGLGLLKIYGNEKWSDESAVGETGSTLIGVECRAVLRKQRADPEPRHDPVSPSGRHPRSAQLTRPSETPLPACGACLHRELAVSSDSSAASACRLGTNSYMSLSWSCTVGPAMLTTPDAYCGGGLTKARPWPRCLPRRCLEQRPIPVPAPPGSEPSPRTGPGARCGRSGVGSR